MRLITEVNGNQDDIMRKGYEITGIRLETNLRVNKRQAKASRSKRVNELLSNALDRAHRRGEGNNTNPNLIKILVPVNTNFQFNTTDLDEQSNSVRLQFIRKLRLVPDYNERQFFIKLTLISNNGENQHHSLLLSYVSDRSDQSCYLYCWLQHLLVHYDGFGRVIPLTIADKAILPTEVIGVINSD